VAGIAALPTLAGRGRRRQVRALTLRLLRKRKVPQGSSDHGVAGVTDYGGAAVQEEDAGVVLLLQGRDDLRRCRARGFEEGAAQADGAGQPADLLAGGDFLLLLKEINSRGPGEEQREEDEDAE